MKKRYWKKPRISSFWVKCQSPSSKNSWKLRETRVLHSKRYVWESTCFFSSFSGPAFHRWELRNKFIVPLGFNLARLLRLFAVRVLQIKDGRISVIVLSEKSEMLRCLCSTVGKSKSYHSWKMSPSPGRNLQLTHIWLARASCPQSPNMKGLVYGPILLAHPDPLAKMQWC